jgi:hypothetical protein
MTLAETTCAIGVFSFLLFVGLGMYLPAPPKEPKK